MIRKLAYFAIAMAFMSLALVRVSEPVNASAEIGELAPSFTAVDINGEEFKLEDQKGKIVVLEWTNHLCPFVKKHYGSGNMQSIQKSATENGVVWVSIVSSAPEKQGHMSAEEAQALVKEVLAGACKQGLADLQRKICHVCNSHARILKVSVKACKSLSTSTCKPCGRHRAAPK